MHTLKTTQYFATQVFLLALFVFSNLGHAQMVEMVEDFTSNNVDTASSTPSQPIILGNQTLFIAYDDAHGYELRKTSGASFTTELVMDIMPGAANSNITILGRAGLFVYFYADDGVHGSELWRTDGTKEGTQLVRDIHPGINGSADRFARPSFNASATLGNKLYFIANNGIHGTELWRTDGTQEGTLMVTDIEPGAKNSFYLTDTLKALTDQSAIVFVSTGGKAWTLSKEERLEEIELPSAPTQTPAVRTPLIREIFTFRNQGKENVLFFDSRPRSSSRGFFQWQQGNPRAKLHADSRIVYAAAYFKGAIHLITVLPGEPGMLWDKLTPDGTLSTLKTGLPTKQFGPNRANFYPLNEHIISMVNGAPYSSDGTQRPDRLDFFSRSASALHEGKLCFRVSNRSNSDYSWLCTDGTPDGTTTRRLPMRFFNILGTLHDGSIMFSGTREQEGTEPWRFDNNDGFQLINNMADNSQDADVRNLVWLQDELWFSLHSNFGTSLGNFSSSQGMQAFPLTSTVALSDVADLSDMHRRAIKPMVASDRLYVKGNEHLWVKTASSFIKTPEPVSLFRNESGNTPTEKPWVIKDDVLYVANSNQMTRVDEQGNPTVVLDSFNNFSTNLQALFVDQGFIYHANESKGARTDGSLSFFERIFAEAEYYGPRNFHRLGDRVLFVAVVRNDSGTYNRSLLSHDGQNDAQLLTNLSTDVVLLGQTITTHSGQTFFAASSAEHGTELWVSDGTRNGTKMLKDIAPGTASSMPTGFFATNLGVYFVATTQETGTELWFTDGTTANTKMAKDIADGAEASSFPGASPQKLHDHHNVMNTSSRLLPTTLVPPVEFSGLSDGRVIFRACTKETGCEPWVSDGTPSGTHLLMDIATGAEHSNPGHFTVKDDIAYFAATDDTHGRELWQADFNQETREVLIFSSGFE